MRSKTWQDNIIIGFVIISLLVIALVVNGISNNQENLESEIITTEASEKIRENMVLSDFGGPEASPVDSALDSDPETRASESTRNSPENDSVNSTNPVEESVVGQDAEPTLPEIIESEPAEGSANGLACEYSDGEAVAGRVTNGDLDEPYLCEDHFYELYPCVVDDRCLSGWRTDAGPGHMCPTCQAHVESALAEKAAEEEAATNKGCDQNGKDQSNQESDEEGEEL